MSRYSGGSLDPKYVEDAWQMLQKILEYLRKGRVWCRTVRAKLTIQQKGGIVKTVTKCESAENSLDDQVVILFAVLAGTFALCANGRCKRFFKRKRQT